MSPVEDHSLADFTRTRWSMVRGLQGAHADRARDALTELAVRYWYPVYAYVRRCGHPQEIAQDITQAFLQQISDDLRLNKAQPPGRFRDWLLARLNGFLGGEWRELAEGGQVPGAPPLPELESRNRGEHEQDETPELAYRRSFALEVLMRGLKRLRGEAGEAGHLDMCQALEPFLARDPLPGQYDELGRKLGVRPLALVLALKRLRQRFRELVREELADTVASADEWVAEQEALLDVLDREGRP
jgi:RNA polymerase sigma-70 factor (ECF subfamily)